MQAPVGHRRHTWHAVRRFSAHLCLVMKGLTGLLLLIAAFAGHGADLAADDVEAYADIAPAATPYHLPVELRVVVEGSLTYEYQIEALPEALPGLEITDLGREVETLRDDRYRLEQRFRLDPLAPGDYYLPGLTIHWGEGETRALPPLLFHARELSEDERSRLATMAPLAEPERLASDRPYTWWTWAAGVVVALAVFAALLAMCYLRGGALETAAPPPPAWDTALQRLRDLEARQLPESGRYERYYVDLSAILRYYIEDRFYVHAPEQTTQEFLAEAGVENILGDGFRDDIAQFLRQSDRVKFARHEPDVEEMKENFEIVKAYVLATIPRAEETPERENAAQEAAV